MTAQKVLLLSGASGYIGTNVQKRFLKDGWTVHVLTRGLKGQESFPDLQPKNIHIYDNTISSVEEALQRATPTLVIHLASKFVSEHKTSDVADLIVSNILLATFLVEACVHNGVRRFINTGTSWQHRTGDAYDPVCLYAATKQAFEDILSFYVSAYPISVITLKLFDVYGPGDLRPKLMNIIMASILSGSSLELSPGEQRLSFTFIEDVVEAFMACALYPFCDNQKGSHKVYALRSKETVSVKELVSLIEQIHGKKISVKFGAKPYRPREVMVPWDANNVWPEGWAPRVSLSNGIVKLLESKGIPTRFSRDRLGIDPIERDTAPPRL